MPEPLNRALVGGPSLAADAPLRPCGPQHQPGWLWVGGPVAWVAGVAAQLQQPVLWSLVVYQCLWAVSLLFIGLYALYFFIPRRPTETQALGGQPWLRRLAFVLLWVGVALCGGASTGWRAAAHQAQVLVPRWQGPVLLLMGRVDELPRATATGWRFAFEVERLNGQPLPEAGFPQRVMLSWTAASGAVAPQVGERWQWAVRLRQPHGLANPHGFDSELWLWEQGVGATGYVRMGRHDPVPVRLSPSSGGLSSWRESVRQRIQSQVSDVRVAGVLTALVVGDQAAIDRRDWDVFRTTGVAHLVSISGLHITLWAWLTMQLVARLWRWAPRVAPVWGVRLLHACPAPVAAAWGGGVLALGYALFSGWGVPAQRTLLMLGVVLGLRLMGRRWPWPLVGAWAMAVVLAWDPWAWLQPGFWLSFVAVGVLMAAGSSPEPSERADMGSEDREGRGPFRRAWVHLTASGRGLMHTQWLMTVSLAPLTLVFFGQVSVVGWVANLVAIPLVTLLITPLALAGVVWQALWWPAAALVDGLMVLLQTLGAWPWARLTWPALTGGLAMAAVLGGLALVWRWPWSLRAMGLAVLLPVLLWRPERPALGEFEVLAADVGQGSGVLIRTASTSLMYDSGPQWGPQSDAGQRVLLPLWQALGETPSQVVLSHRDGDHVGGALAVLQALAVAKPSDAPAVSVWASFAPRAMVSALSDPALARQLLAQPPRWTRCEAGQQWELDGVRFEVMHPSPALYERDPPTRSNNLSCVLWVRGRHASALLTGDLEADQEAVLVQAHPELQVDWLLAPHHGSRTSSSERLLDAVRPRWVVVQAGFLSRYGHPAPQVLARYREKGIRWVATPACGAAHWRSDRPESVQCQRAQTRRYWQVAPDEVPPPASLEQSSEPPMEGME